MLMFDLITRSLVGLKAIFCVLLFVLIVSLILT